MQTLRTLDTGMSRELWLSNVINTQNTTNLAHIKILDSDSGMSVRRKNVHSDVIANKIQWGVHTNTRGTNTYIWANEPMKLGTKISAFHHDPV